jgi:hypothetical protein
LSCRKPGFIDTIIDIVVNPVVVFFNLRLEVFRIQVDINEFFRQQFVEGRVEHADNLGGLIVYNPIGFFIVKGWHGKATAVLWVLLKVDLAEVGEIGMDWITSNIFAWDFFIRSSKAPACIREDMLIMFICWRKGCVTFVAHVPVDRSIGDDLLQPL